MCSDWWLQFSFVFSCICPCPLESLFSFFQALHRFSLLLGLFLLNTYGPLAGSWFLAFSCVLCPYWLQSWCGSPLLCASEWTPVWSPWYFFNCNQGVSVATMIQTSSTCESKVGSFIVCMDCHSCLRSKGKTVAKPQAVVVVVDPEKLFTERYILKPDKALVVMGIMMQVTAVLVREIGKYRK